MNYVHVRSSDGYIVAMMVTMACLLADWNGNEWTSTLNVNSLLVAGFIPR